MQNILSTLTNEEKKLIKIKHFERNAIIFNEGDLCTNLVVVLDGSIHIVGYLENGSEVLYNSVLKNELFGENLLFSSDLKYRGDVIAKTECNLAFIQKENLIILIQKNKSFLQEYLRIAGDFAKKLNFRIKLLSIEKSEDRLTFYLSNSGGKCKSNITELAKILGFTREATSRLVSRLIKNKRLSKNKDFIELVSPH